MHKPSRQHHLFTALLLFICSFFGWSQAAQADDIDEFLSKYKEIEKYAPPNTIPISSKTIEAYKELLSCIGKTSDDKGLANCVLKFHETDAGKKAGKEIEIPEAVFDVGYAYVAWREGDVWGVIEHLGKAAACAILQVLTGGTVDVCGLLEDLYELAKGVYDTAKWVVDFLGDAGETIEDIADAIDCFFSDCSGPKLPEEYFVLEYIFKPKVIPGRDALEHNLMAYTSLRQQLHNNARKDPAVLSKPFIFFGTPNKTWPNGSFSEKATVNAEMMFDTTVDDAWTAHMGNDVLPALGVARNNYAKNKQNVDQIAQKALAVWAKKPSSMIVSAVANLCVADFHAKGYEHVDRWVLKHEKLASTPGFAALQAVTHKIWCLSTFWGQNKGQFAAHFVNYAKSNLCSPQNGILNCKTVKKFQDCDKLLSNVDQQDQCQMDVHAIGQNVAQEIRNYFKAKKSKYPCKNIVLPSLPGSKTTTPVIFQCTRPTQRYYCDKYYQEHYGLGGKTPLPVKVLSCGLKKSSAYQAMEDKFWQVTIPKLVGNHPNMDLPVYTTHEGRIDPLVIFMKGPIFAEVQADAKQLDVAVLAKFDSYDWPIDGEEEPTLISEGKMAQAASKTVPIQKIKPTQESLGGGFNQPDPAGKFGTSQAAVDVGKTVTKSKGGGFAGSQAVAPVNVKQQFLPGFAAGTGIKGKPTKTLSGKLPPSPGQQGRGGAVRAPKATTTPTRLKAVTPPKPARLARNTRQPAPVSLPDLTSLKQIKVAGQTTTWGARIRIQAAAGHANRAGQCEFPISYTLHNRGKARSAAFTVQWQIGRQTRETTSLRLAPGGRRLEKGVLVLQPGSNTLTLTIDGHNQVTESDEKNNRFRLNIDVSGRCESNGNSTSATRSPSPPASGRLGLPAR